MTPSCDSPLCIPTRYAFMTGLFAAECAGYADHNADSCPLPAAYGLLNMVVRQDVLYRAEAMAWIRRASDDANMTLGLDWMADWNDPVRRIDLRNHNMPCIGQAGFHCLWVAPVLSTRTALRGAAATGCACSVLGAGYCFGCSGHHR